MQPVRTGQRIRTPDPNHLEKCVLETNCARHGYRQERDAFREAARAFIRGHYPPEMRVKNLYTERQRLLWHGVLRYPAKARYPLSRG
jgi:hypothetical protein